MKTKLLITVIAPAMAYSVCAILLTFCLSGCVDVPTQTGPTSMATSVPFDPAAYAPYRQSGTAKITGQAFLKTRGGDVKVAAGDTVTLSPATPFWKEVRRIGDLGMKVSNVDQTVMNQINDTVHKTVADAQGNFEFSNLPNGEYLVETTIEWEVPGAYGMSTTGGLVYKYVTVKDGETARIMLTE